MEIVLTLAVFFLILVGFAVCYAVIQGGNARSAHSVVKRYTSRIADEDDVDILYYRKFSSIKIFDKILATMPAVRALDELMQQGGVKILAGVFILFSLTLAVVAFLFGYQLFHRFEFALVLALIALVFPYLGLLYKRRQRRINFEELFPDALDLMGYSLKAGHSIMASLKMVAEEMADPVGEEFGHVVEEINFGKNVEATLYNFARRIDSAELRYFVTSVIIQRETGGNLVEILEKISETVRKKFRFRERVRALTAEGKISAVILIGLPFLIALVTSITNKKYVMLLVTDPIGHYMIGGAAVLMCIGSLVMYRLVKLDM